MSLIGRKGIVVIVAGALTAVVGVWAAGGSGVGLAPRGRISAGFRPEDSRVRNVRLE